MFRLLPKEEKFYEMFIEAATNIHKAANHLKSMLETGSDFERYAREIKEMEHIGDKLTHEIIIKLNKTFITPFDREDIHYLSKTLDDVIDHINAAANLILILRITQYGQEAIRLAQIIVEATDEILKGIQLLNQIDKIYPHCIEINRLENEGDTVFNQGLVKLFENGSDPVTIIKLKDFYQNLELATDRCEDVANVLEAIVVKNQ
jgi:predicted phosphate transport protein (TIGR00153 family)